MLKNDVLIERQVGYGRSGVVCSAIHVSTGNTVAVKQMAKPSRAERESRIHSQLSHPCIPKVFGVFDDDDCDYIVMEYCDGISLKDRLSYKGSISENEAKNIISQLLSVINYLHETAGVTHRDVKLENVLLSYNQSIKLIDFGFAETQVTGMNERIGTPAYVAPEIVLGEEYSCNVDIWSIGIITYTLLSGSLPFSSPDIVNCMEKIVKTEPKYDEKWPENVTSFIRKCLDKDKNSRPSATELLNHPWIKQKEQTGLEKRNNTNKIIHRPPNFAPKVCNSPWSHSHGVKLLATSTTCLRMRRLSK